MEAGGWKMASVGSSERGLQPASMTKVAGASKVQPAFILDVEAA